MNGQTSVYDTTIRLLFLLLVVSWCLMIMLPFVGVILWSLILAIALLPLHSKFSAKIGYRPKLASFIIVLTMFLIVIVPIAALVASLVDEVRELKTMYSEGALSIPYPNEKVKSWPLVGTQLFDVWSAASANLGEAIIKYKDQLTEIGKTVGRGIMGSVSATIQILVSLFIAGILLVVPGAGESVRKFFRKLAGNKGDEFADVATKTVGSVVKGILGVALILALLHGIIFMLAGVPFAGIWTVLVFILCVLQMPVIIVTLPIIIYLFSGHELSTAIIWTVLLFIAGLSDNVLKPILLGKGAPVPMLVIFIGVIGGFIFSGFLGMFTGAIMLSIGYKLFVSWLNSVEPTTQRE